MLQKSSGIPLSPKKLVFSGHDSARPLIVELACDDAQTCAAITFAIVSRFAARSATSVSVPDSRSH